MKAGNQRQGKTDMRQFSRVVALAAAVLLGRSANAQEFLDLNKPITLDIPGMELPFVTSLQPLGGWPLTIRMFANKPLGIGTASNAGLPPIQSKAWIVWADPDGKFSFACYPSIVVTCPPVDETYLEFTTGISTQGETGDFLTVKSYTLPNYANPVYVGNTSDTTIWGIHKGGFGRSTSIPGLVILADTGAGREFTPDPALGIHQTGNVRNLAGFVDSVAWTVNDAMPFLPRTSVTAHMNVPTGLFQPILFVDYGSCTYPSGNGQSYQGACPTFKWSIDGRYTALDTTTVLNAWKAIVTTVRVFVVDGPAPDLVGDGNGDGVIDSRDVVRMTNPETGNHYKLLSGERVIRFKTLEDYMFPGIPFDFDTDGMIHPPAPAMGGTVKPIPR
jgi:hypothetical protein